MTDAEKPSPQFPICGIGASAGGLEALTSLVRSLATDGMAYVVVQHLSPDHESLLAQLLGRETKLPVVTAQDGMRVESNHVYCIPPGRDLAILQGVLHLVDPPLTRPRLSIDSFLRSLADDLGSLAVGVVLSGTGSDGALGLRAIKAAGGLTLVQTPATARYPAMPLAALDHNDADYVMSAAEIGETLSSLGQHPYLTATRAERPPQESLGRIFVLLRDAFGTDLSFYKHSTIERRIERRMALRKLERLDDYVRQLAQDRSELATLYKSLLISVTSFFRDQEPFEFLKSQLVPRLLERDTVRAPVRIWVPGCATGEEAYSIAIALLEGFDQRAPDVQVQLFATDIDDDAVNFGRRAVYPPNIALDVSAERLERFFVRRNGYYQVARRVRDMVVFATPNVAKDPPFSRLDLISCRNLMIYFQPALQKRVLRIFHYALRPDGHLLLGTSESVGDSAELFSVVDRKHKLYAKKNVPSSATFEVNFGELPHRSQHESQRRLVEMKPQSVQQIADRKVLERFAPAGVVVDENFDVVQFRGRTGSYLEPLPGHATLHLLKLARPELVTELRALMRSALDLNAPQHSGRIDLRVGNDLVELVIHALPLEEPETRGRCLLVLFQENQRRVMADGEQRPQDGVDARLQQLERELSSSKDYLQSVIEELESSNEELKSSNEELQSANEELQSTNEELETSKEELQSTNEELVTVNDELHSRMGELSQTNDDLQSLLTEMDTALVLVGSDLRIRRCSGAGERLLGLGPADIGRPIAQLDGFARIPRLETLVREVIATAGGYQRDILANDERWYRFSIAAYHPAEHISRGAVLSFIAKDALHLADLPLDIRVQTAVLNALGLPLLALDDELRVIWTSASFVELVGETQLVGVGLRDLAGRGWAPHELIERLDHLLRAGEPFKQLALDVEAPKGDGVGPRKLRVSATRIPGEGNERKLMLLELAKE